MPTSNFKRLQLRRYPLFCFLLPFCYHLFQKWYFQALKAPLDWWISSGVHKHSTSQLDLNDLTGFGCILCFRLVRLEGLHMCAWDHGIWFLVIPPFFKAGSKCRLTMLLWFIGCHASLGKIKSKSLGGQASFQCLSSFIMAGTKSIFRFDASVLAMNHLWLLKVLLIWIWLFNNTPWFFYLVRLIVHFPLKIRPVLYQPIT